jgi:hypothetical protein
VGAALLGVADLLEVRLTAASPARKLAPRPSTTQLPGSRPVGSGHGSKWSFSVDGESKKLERETGSYAPSTKQSARFVYRLG